MKRIPKELILLAAFTLTVNCCIGQKKISITIDDVPNTSNYEHNGYKNTLLEKLDSLQVAFTIFVNGGLLQKTNAPNQNAELLREWCIHPNSTVGNHTFSHSRYSDMGYAKFKKDILDGEKAIAEYLGSQSRYFRFPYNDLGKDSIEHSQIKSLLDSLNYYSAPFTVESSDWMFNAVYLHFLENDSIDRAHDIGELYVSKTMELLHFYDSLSTEIYDRSVSQIYLCHDNALNQKYLPQIIDLLYNSGYQVGSLSDVLQDPIYSQDNAYYKKWGVSWFYRWMDTRELRLHWMRQEPDFSEVETLFEEIE